MANVTLLDQSMCIFFIILCGLTCYIPLYLKTLLDKGILQMMIMFGGGIFLGLAFNHTIPETYIGFELEKEEMYPSLKIPYAPLTIAAGYLTLVILDLIASNFTDYSKITDDCYENEIVEKVNYQEKSNDIENSKINDTTNKLENDKNENNKNNNNREISHQNKFDNNVEKQDEISKELLYEENSKVAPLILTLSLIFHVMIESMTIGLQEEQSEIYALLFGICIHKVFTSLSLGLTYIKNDLDNCLIYTLLLIYTISAPIGVTIGILIKEEANHLVHLVFAGIASGSFLYIGINEVLVKGLSNGNSKRNRNYNLLSYIMGYLVIVLILYFIQKEGHQDEHHEGH